MWRPDYWHSPYSQRTTINGVSLTDAYEAGAGHMLQAMVRWMRSHEEHTMIPEEGKEYDYFPIPSAELDDLLKET